MKTTHLNNAGPARGKQLSHGHSWPARSERKGSAAAWQGLGPRPLSAWPAWQAEAECLAGVRAGAAARLGQRPVAISGHGRASWQAHGMCEEKASAVG